MSKSFQSGCKFFYLIHLITYRRIGPTIHLRSWVSAQQMCNFGKPFENQYFPVHCLYWLLFFVLWPIVYTAGCLPYLFIYFDWWQLGEDWDDSIQSKEQVDANLLSKHEAGIRRERALAYAYSHQVARLFFPSLFLVFSCSCMAVGASFILLILLLHVGTC